MAWATRMSAPATVARVVKSSTRPMTRVWHTSGGGLAGAFHGRDVLEHLAHVRRAITRSTKQGSPSAAAHRA